MNGLIVAFDRRTGDERWRYQAPGGINAWPAVANHTIVWPIGMGRAQLLALRLPPPPPVQWVRIPTDPANTPRARHNHAMVYDEEREVILMHGGRALVRRSRIRAHWCPFVVFSDRKLRPAGSLPRPHHCRHDRLTCPHRKLGNEATPPWRIELWDVGRRTVTNSFAGQPPIRLSGC